MNDIIRKLTSGRFLVTLMLACTYCYLAIFMVTRLSDKITGDFVLGFIGGFSTSFMLILQWYFDKEPAQVIKVPEKDISGSEPANIG